jgi:hypothetical protein
MQSRLHVTDVLTGGQLRHDPAVSGVQRDLGRYGVGAELPAVFDDADRGFIAGSLDT